MSFNYAALRHRIRASEWCQKTMAAEAGISEWQLCRKLNGKSEFTQSEILRLCGALNIPPGEIGRYFFSRK